VQSAELWSAAKRIVQDEPDDTLATSALVLHAETEGIEIEREEAYTLVESARIVPPSPNGKGNLNNCSEVDTPIGVLPATESQARPYALGKRELRIITDVEIENLPKPEWLVENLIPMMALAVIFGPPGAGKSFLAVAMALSIGSGFRLVGNSVQPGPVVYVAPEGGHGLGARVRAWKRHHGYAGSANVYFVPATVSLLDPSAVQELINAIRGIGPVAVFFDTLHRSIPGGDENSSQDMGHAIALADRVKEELRTAVILVHHTNKGGQQERGSTALRGAADVMVSVSNADGTITVACEKQKDSAPFAAIDMALTTVDDSAVITARSELPFTAGLLTELQRKTLNSLRTSFLEDGATATQWQKASGVDERRFYEVRTALYNGGYVDRDKKGRGARYCLTDKARAVFTAVTADHCEVTAPQRAAVTAAERLSLREPQQRSNGGEW
jgi:hypothetical protein